VQATVTAHLFLRERERVPSLSLHRYLWRCFKLRLRTTLLSRNPCRTSQPHVLHGSGAYADRQTDRREKCNV